MKIAYKHTSHLSKLIIYVLFMRLKINSLQMCPIKLVWGLCCWFQHQIFENCYMRQCGAQMSLLIAYLDQTAFMFQDSNKFSWSFSSRFSLVRLGLTSFCIGWFFEGIRFKEVTNVSTSGMSTTIHHFLVSRQLNLKVQLLSFSIIVK